MAIDKNIVVHQFSEDKEVFVFVPHIMGLKRMSKAPQPPYENLPDRGYLNCHTSIILSSKDELWVSETIEEIKTLIDNA